jgi:very-short-patch-repair endonuclease
MKNRLTELARKMRKEATDAERLLWNHLRTKRINNLKFRRQQPIGHYIVDFICYEKKLIIEVDGGQHAEENEKDLKRTQWLNQKGFRVIRFWNNEVLYNCDGVLEEIFEQCKNTLPLSLPEGGRWGKGEKNEEGNLTP